MAKDSGGGINLNKNVRPPVRTGQSAMGVRPGYPDNLGNMRGNHAMDKGTVPAPPTPMQTVKPPISVPLGNEVAGNVGKGGPGAGRTVMRSGSQGHHGAADAGVGRAAGPADRGSRAILGRPGQKV